MRPIPSAPPPQKYVQLLAAQSTYSVLSSEPAIRQALWEQQGGICAYCERRLRHPTTLVHQTRIEHFHPQRGSLWTSDCKLCSGARNDSDAPTAWTNMLLCCDGNEHLGKDFTCDKLKDKTDVCSRFRNPKRWQGGNLVDIDRAGIAFAVPGLPPGADEVVEKVLNLNAEHLVDVRKTILNARRKAYVMRKKQNKGMSVEEHRKLAQKIRNEALLREYPSTLLSFAASIA